MSLEYCFRCGDPTGRAGRGDDSIYIGDEGPFCEECYAKSPTASMTIDHLELAKAIFAAGFRLGHKYGQDAAVAADWGTHSREPQTPESAWERDVKWMLETKFEPLDPDEPKDWEKV